MPNLSHYAFPVFLMIFLVARRIKRSIGFQKFSQPRLIVRIVLLSLVTIVFLVTAALHPLSYFSDFGGALLGLALLYWSVQHSVFELRGTDYFYRTNIWIEIIVVVLFLSRFLYRISIFYEFMSVRATTPEELKSRLNSLRDPVTGGLIFILFAYYIGYSFFVLRKVAELKSESKPVPVQ
jgi:hypothetical protein